MVRFLHTADWHLGIKYLKLGSKAERARETRIETVVKLMDAAKKHKVDFILVAGDYTMSKDGHIRIEIFYDHFPPRIKLIARLIALCCFVIFMGVLLWQASWMGLNSLKMGEKVTGAFRMPLYPFKLLIPICVFLFLLQGIAVICRRKD